MAGPISLNPIRSVRLTCAVWLERPLKKNLLTKMQTRRWEVENCLALYRMTGIESHEARVPNKRMRGQLPHGKELDSHERTSVCHLLFGFFFARDCAASSGDDSRSCSRRAGRASRGGGLHAYPAGRPPVLPFYGGQYPCLEYSQPAVYHEKICGSAAPRIRPAGRLYTRP